MPCSRLSCVVSNIGLYLIITAQEVLESLKDRWFQADNPPADQLLNEEEFLSFLHPEHSRGMLKYMVKEIVRDLGMLTSSLNFSTIDVALQIREYMCASFFGFCFNVLKDD